MLIIRRPHGITGIVRFVVAADPLQEFWAAIFCRDLDPVVHEAEADAFLREGTENLAMISLNRGMLIAAVAVKHDRICAVEGVGCLRPAIAIHRCFHARSLRQALLEEEQTGMKFMHARRMARLTGNEHNVFIRGGEQPSRQEDGREEEP